MYTFETICLGDMFNTKAARWVKVSATQAVVVMSGVFKVGDIRSIPSDERIILLYSSVLEARGSNV